jgi:hypothetical protein
LLYKDITNDHWSAKYISLAKERWWMAPLEEWTVLNNFILPNKSITKEEVIEILNLLDIWEPLDTSSVEDMLGKANYPTRANVWHVLVKKFLLIFIDYFYMQENNISYYGDLAQSIEWRSSKEQLKIIQTAIDTLAEMNEDEMIVTEWQYPFWIQSFLKKIINQS